MNRRKKILITASVLAAFAAVYFTASYLANMAAKKRVDSFAEEISRYISMEYEDVNVNLLRNSLTVSNLELKQDNYNRIAVKKAVVEKIDVKSAFPSKLRISFHGIDIENNSRSLKKAVSDTLGYSEELDFDLRLDYVFNQENGDFNLKALELSSQNAGKITISAYIEKTAFDSDFLNRLYSETDPSMFKNAQVVFTDDSITDRAFELIAGFTGISLSDLKSLLKIQAGYVKEMFQAGLDEESMIKIKSFIDTPGILTISSSPEEPVTLEMLIANFNKPVKLLAMLDLKVR